MREGGMEGRDREGGIQGKREREGEGIKAHRVIDQGRRRERVL